jgi:hypothetical protein
LQFVRSAAAALVRRRLEWAQGKHAHLRGLARRSQLRTVFVFSAQDVLIVLDNSGSMSQFGRMAL